MLRFHTWFQVTKQENYVITMVLNIYRIDANETLRVLYTVPETCNTISCFANNFMSPMHFYMKYTDFMHDLTCIHKIFMPLQQFHVFCRMFPLDMWSSYTILHTYMRISYHSDTSICRVIDFTENIHGIYDFRSFQWNFMPSLWCHMSSA